MQSTHFIPHALCALVAGALVCASAPAARAADPPSLAARIQVLEDEAAVHNLLMEYGRRLDAGDFHGWAELFAQDGVWVGGFGEAKGPVALEAMLNKFMGPSNPRHPDPHSGHVLTNPIITIHGDRATALSKWTFVQPNAQGRPEPLVMGHYVDQLVRENGTWKFLRREVWGDIPFADPTKIPPAKPASP
jgi:hypothetical protein